MLAPRCIPSEFRSQDEPEWRACVPLPRRKGPPLPTTCPTFGSLLEAVRIMDSTPIQLLLQMQEVGPRGRCRFADLGILTVPSSDDSYGPNAPTAEKRAEAVIRQATGPDYTLEGIRFVERPRGEWMTTRTAKTTLKVRSRTSTLPDPNAADQQTPNAGDITKKLVAP